MPAPSFYSDGGQPFSAYCPHCRSELQIQPQQAGATVACPNCRGHFQASMSQAPLPHPAPTYPAWGYQPRAQVNVGIKVCVLISGIWNIVVGLFWISTLCGVFVGVPQIVLAVFEIVYFTQADNKPLPDSLAHARLLGAFEILSGLFNGVSFVCGIVTLVLASNHDS